MAAGPDLGGEIVVDARGHRCPVPALRLRRALEAAPPGASVVLIADDPMARIDVPHLLHALGLPLVRQDAADGVMRFTTRR